MEYIFSILFIGAVAYLLIRNKSVKPAQASEPLNDTVPYKVPEPAATTPIPLVVTNSNPADNVPLVADVAAPVVAEVVAKKPRKPRAPKVEATPVKKAAVKKAAPKKVAAVKAAPKAAAKAKSKK